MKILLIEPPKAPITIGGEDAFIFESLALEYVAAGVSPDHDVRILDMRLDKGFERVLREYAPDVVGITAYTVHVNTVRTLFEQAKRWNPEVLTVVGGHHATIAPGDFASRAIDLVVAGEGVWAFREIVRRLENNEGFEGIPGVAPSGQGGPVVPVTLSDADLDEFPLPDRSLTGKYRKHYYSEWMKPLASIRTSKGCSFRCNFCALWRITQGRYFARRPEAIVDELSTIDEECVFFADDESLVDAARMKTLADMIKASGIKKRYFLYARSDTISRNPKLLETWRDVGLERVFVGLEFAGDDDLAFIGKGSTSQDNVDATRILRDLDIDVYASFILRPEFDRSDFRALRDYCRRLRLDFASFGVLTPLPGTELYDEARALMLTRNYDYYDFIHTLLPTKLPLKEFYSEYYDLYAKGFSWKSRLSIFAKYPWRERLPALVGGLRVFNRLKKAYRDYENLQPPPR